jgi:hypothetical protein
MTGVMSDHNAAPMLPFIVHGRVRPIIGNGCHGGAQAASGLARGPYASLGRGGSMPRGLDAPVFTLQGSARGEDCFQRGARVGRFDGVTGLAPSEALWWGSGEAGTGPKPRAT